MNKINTWPGWKCVKTLGSGAFGTVYEIEREENGKLYKAALKVISIPQNEADIDNVFSEGMSRQDATDYFQSFVNDFTNEIALMSDLKGYTNIVSYEDHMVITHEGRIGWDILIRMELLTPLHKWIVNHPLDENAIIRLGSDICRALELCQKNKIIHRDIKPENIFVNKNGDFKLGDFGIARVVEKTSYVMSQQRGTYTYMAPEVYKGQYYDHTADIYSLGIVLYRFLNNNRTPFLPQGTLVPLDREIAVERRIAGEKISAPMNGSEKLKQAVMMAIEYDPSKRMQSAQVFRSMLEQCLGCTGQEFDTEVTEISGEQSEKVQKSESVKSPIQEEDEPTGRGKSDWDDSTVRAQREVICSERKKKKWMLPAGIGAALTVVLLVFVICLSGKDNDKTIQPVKEVKEQNIEGDNTEEIINDNVSEETVMLEFNEFILDYKGMTYDQYKRVVGKEAQWIRGRYFEAELPGTNLTIVFHSLLLPMLADDEVDYRLDDSDKIYRLQGRVSDFFNITSGEIQDGIQYMEFEEHCSNEVKLLDVQIGNYALASTMSDYYAVYLLEIDDEEKIEVEFHVDLTGLEDGKIEADTEAWLVFDYNEQHENLQSEMLSELIHADVIADYGNNLNPYDYHYYESSSFENFSFYYPSNLYNAVDVSTEGISDEYGTVLEEIVFTASDNSSKALFQLKERESERTVAEDTQRIYDYYKNNIPGFQKIIFSNDEETKPGRLIATGFDSEQQIVDYILVTITEDNIMTMRISFPTDGVRESEDFKEKEYFVECMYRLCGYSGSTYEVRNYEQFLNGESGEKK